MAHRSYCPGKIGNREDREALNQRSLHNAAEAVRERFPNAEPVCGLILGSGLAGAADFFSVRDRLDYQEIPEFGRPTVGGHPGCLLWADYAGLQAFVFQGRRHWYEGDGWEPVALPVYLLKTFGACVLIVTNAAGGIRHDLQPGQLMIIDDHINAMASNPLIGPRDPFWGPRFPDQSALYDPQLRALMDRAAEHEGKTLAHGVYLAVSGPTLETPAEVRAFKIWGADAVGMSTVPEAILANAAGLRVLGLSCIANVAADVSCSPMRHEDVTAVASDALPEVTRVLQAFLKELARTGVTQEES